MPQPDVATPGTLLERGEQIAPVPRGDWSALDALLASPSNETDSTVNAVRLGEWEGGVGRSLQQSARTNGDHVPRLGGVSVGLKGVADRIPGLVRGVAENVAQQLKRVGEPIPIERDADLARIIDSPLTHQERVNAQGEFGDLILERPDGDLEIRQVGDLLGRIGRSYRDAEVIEDPTIRHEIAAGMKLMQAIHTDVLPHLLGYTRLEAMPEEVQQALRAFTEELTVSYSTSPHGNQRLKTLYAGLQQQINWDQNGRLRGIHRAGEFISIYVHNTLGHFLHRYTSEVVNRPHFLSGTEHEGRYGHSFFPQLKESAYLRGELPTQVLSEIPSPPHLSVAELSNKLVSARIDVQDGQREQLEREISLVPNSVAGRIELAVAGYLQNNASAPMQKEIKWMHAVLTGEEYEVTDAQGIHTEKVEFEADQRGVLGHSVEEGIGLHTAGPVRLLDVKKALGESSIHPQARKYADLLATHFVILRHRGVQKKMAVLVPLQYASVENLATLRQEFPNVTFIDGHIDPSGDITRFAAQGYEYPGGGEDGEFEVARREGDSSYTIADGDVGVIGMCGNTEGTPPRWAALSPRRAGSLAAATWAKELLAEPTRDVQGVQTKLRQARRRTNRNWERYVASLSREDRVALNGAWPTATTAHVVGFEKSRAAVISKQGDGQVFVIRDGVVRRITFDSAVTEDFYRGKITQAEQVEIQEALDRIVTRKDLNRVMLEIARGHMKQELEADGVSEVMRKFDIAERQLSVYEDYGSREHVRAFDFLTPVSREDGKERTQRQEKRAREEMRREYLGYVPPHMRKLVDYYNARNTARVAGRPHAEEHIVPVNSGDTVIIAAAGTPPAAIASAAKYGDLQNIVRAADRVSGPWSGGVVGMRVM